jgi:hypothetical protein
MSRQEIDEAVASVTGERVEVIKSRGFSIADPFDVASDPESRSPMVLNSDSMSPADSPEYSEPLKRAARTVFNRDSAGSTLVDALSEP